MNDQTILGIIDDMRNRYFVGHERALLDEYANRLEAAYWEMVNNPIEWCNCDQCVCKLEAEAKK